MSSAPPAGTTPPTTSGTDSTSSSPRRPGILIVGFGGGNGVTAAAGVLANQKNITWEGPTGRNSPNYLGCITQLPSKGGSGGYRERYALADANHAAIGGWDIRPTPLGEALYNARILDFDLVRQVREEMDAFRLLPGVWDPDFIGESQHESATHVTGDGDSQQSRLEHLRRDIREFREGEGVTGHVTVIWSASVERPSEREFQQPSEVRWARVACRLRVCDRRFFGNVFLDKCLRCVCLKTRGGCAFETNFLLAMSSRPTAYFNYDTAVQVIRSFGYYPGC